VSEQRTSERSGGRFLWYVVALLLIAILGFYLWKGFAVRRAENRLVEARTTWSEETRRALEGRTIELLRLSALPLGFAVRSAVIEGDLRTVDAYLDRLVAEPRVERVVFADAGGRVVVATDESLVGRSLTDVYPRLEVASDQPDVYLQGDRFHAVVPITGINERLGILVLTYAPEREAPEETAAQ
jgi:hypothetical protein